MSKLSTFLTLAIVSVTLTSGHRAFGQAATAAASATKAKPAAAANTKYSEMAMDPALKPIDPAIVASNEDEATEDKKRARERAVVYNTARKVLSGQIPADDAGKKKLDAWYTRYLLPSFTSPMSLSELPDLRQSLLNKDLRPARSVEAIAYVRGKVLTYMKAYAQSPGKYNFHPAVRYNAMMLIGGLNSVEYGSRYPDGTKALTPVPLPAALDLLISEYKSPTQIDAVRVAALVGLHRHAKLNLGARKERQMDGGKKRVIVEEMTALLNSAAPAGRTAEGHTWMQRRAIDILAALGMVGPYPQANAALERIVADKNAPISLRCTASEALAQWAPASKATIDVGTVSKNLGMIAVEACTDELVRIAALVAQEQEMERLRELIKKPNPAATGQFGAGGGGYGEEEAMSMMGSTEGEEEEGMDMEEMMGMGDMEGMGMYGMGGELAAAIPTDPRIVWSQRRLKYQLTCVKRGLEGMAVAGAKSQHEKTVTQVAEAINTVLTFTDPPAEKPDLEGLTESIQKGVRELAFLSPAAADIGADPLTDPTGELPPGTEPTAPSAPAAPPAIGPTTPPAGGEAPDALPPGV